MKNRLLDGGGFSNGFEFYLVALTEQIATACCLTINQRLM
jgi:hypothetical protein